MAVLAAVVAAGIVYFMFHALVGQNGLVSYVRIKKKKEEKARELERCVSELDRLKRRTKLLSNDSLDMDLLEERGRVVLGYVDASDVVLKEKTVKVSR
jgi:cell division protein FtsB